MSYNSALGVVFLNCTVVISLYVKKKKKKWNELNYQVKSFKEEKKI